MGCRFGSPSVPCWLWRRGSAAPKLACDAGPEADSARRGDACPCSEPVGVRSLAVGSRTVSAPAAVAAGAFALPAAASSCRKLAGCRDAQVCHADGPVLIDGPAYGIVSGAPGSPDGFDRSVASGSQTDRVAG